MDIKPEQDNIQPDNNSPVILSPEPIFARVVQLAILMLGIMLLIAVAAGMRAGVIASGVLLVGSVIPPLRAHVDRWLTGDLQGREANQVTIIRVAAGCGLIAFGLLGQF